MAHKLTKGYTKNLHLTDNVLLNLDKKQAWIIYYTWKNTDDWIGCFPDELYQWFVCESKRPRIFDTKKEAQDYIDNNCLICAKPLKVAGFQ